MICRPIHADEIKLEFGFPMEERSTEKETPLINRSHLKSVVADAKQHPTRTAYSCPPVLVKQVTTYKASQFLVCEILAHRLLKKDDIKPLF
jgi:hypothetical protein